MRAPRQVQRRSRQLTGEDAAQQAGSAQREHPVPGFVQFCRCPPAMLLQGGSLGFLASGAGDRQGADPDQEKESTPKNGCSPAHQMPASSAMTGPSAEAGIRSPVSSASSRLAASGSDSPRRTPPPGVNQVRPPAVVELIAPPNSSSRPAPFTT